MSTVADSYDHSCDSQTGILSRRPSSQVVLSCKRVLERSCTRYKITYRDHNVEVGRNRNGGHNDDSWSCTLLRTIVKCSYTAFLSRSRRNAEPFWEPYRFGCGHS